MLPDLLFPPELYTRRVWCTVRDMSKSAFNTVTGESHADTLAAEFCIVYTTRGGNVHAQDCESRRVKRGQHRTDAHRGALRHGAQLAPCCKDHEARLLTLGARVGAW